MQRYFGTIQDKKAFLKESDVHHLVDVVRIKKGENIEVVDEGETFLCKIEATSPLSIEVVNLIEENREPDNQITLAFAILKGDHNDLIVEKGTELGASTFIPFVSERTVIKVNKGEEDNRLRRLRKIVSSSSQQCRRTNVPEVKDYMSLKEVLDLEFDEKLLAYENLAGESCTLLEKASSIEKGKRILIVIGPEGGFSPKEADLAASKGFAFVSLGRRILRAETACFASLSILSSLSEK
ncbi:MAG: 16S rRNA (uracil(1498)-N(3))-methyltransferase [Bacilli bacterium]|nr:16S rRNA (uracil(1498)-N(3))-methyltransferase [Bacilli bacterium]